MLEFGTIALATADGVVMGMSEKEQVHPLYKTPAYEVRTLLELNPMESELADELLSHNVADTVRHSIRSFVAQLGCAGFAPGTVKIAKRPRRSHVEITTLLTDISNRPDDRLFSSLRRNISSERALLARLLLLPQGARDGERHLPLQQHVHYAFDRELLSDDALDAAWAGASGRAMILNVRKHLGAVPVELGSGAFLVGEVEANVGDDCWVLEPELLRDGHSVQVLHDQSCLYDPGRTRGPRQVEIRNINGHAESLQGIHIRASVYRTDPAFFRCEHRNGV